LRGTDRRFESEQVLTGDPVGIGENLTPAVLARGLCRQHPQSFSGTLRVPVGLSRRKEKVRSRPTLGDRPPLERYAVLYEERLDVIHESEADPGLPPVLQAQLETDEHMNILAEFLTQPFENEVPLEVTEERLFTFEPHDESAVRVGPR